MNILLKKKYINKILENKKILVSELTDEFGIQYEDLLNNRFDKIKFIFFVSLENYKKYIKDKYSYLCANKVVQFIKESNLLSDVYVNDKFKDICGFIIESEQNEELFNAIFDNHFLSFDYRYNHKGVVGIYSFDPKLDYNQLRSYAQHRNVTIEEFITNSRCDFFRSIGKYPSNYTNEMICNDQNYPVLCNNYEELMRKYNQILSDVDENIKNDIDIFDKLNDVRKKIYINNYENMLEELSIYLSEDDKLKITSGEYTLDEIEFLKAFFYIGQSLNHESKIETFSQEKIQQLFSSYYGQYNQNKCTILMEKVKEARQSAAKKYNGQILDAFVFESNCDIANVEIEQDISICNSELFASFEQENGVEKGRLLFFDPYACDEEYLDIHLRHELRHSLTSNIRKYGDFDIVKVGNAEYIYLGEELISTNNEFYNELFTQKKAIENAKRSYENGVYILSPNGSSFPEGLTSTYDEYLVEFDKIYSTIPQSAVVSQIEEDNENLYKFMSADKIKQLEDYLYNYNLTEDNLDIILSRTGKSKLSH